MTILLKNVSYLDINSESIKRKDIYIKDNFIFKIDEDIKIKADEVVDCTNKLAVPAYVNSHTHLGMTQMRNVADDLELNSWLNNHIWPIESRMTPEDIYWASKLSLIENIKSGVGTVCDMYFSLDKVSEAVIESGIRGVISQGLMDIDGNGNRKLEEFKSYYKDYNNSGNGRVKIIPGPHAIYTCSKDYLKKIFNMSLNMEGRINIHLSETIKEVEDCIKLTGLRPAEYLNSFGFFEQKIIAAHCVHLNDDEINLISSKEVYPIYNPTSNLKLASGFTRIKEMIKRGVVLGIGTDGSASNNNQDMCEEIHIASIVNKAVELDAEATKAIDIIKMATVNGAKAMGIKSGLIEEGSLADISLYDLDSISFTPKNNLISALCYSASSNDVKDLIVDGKFVMKNREVLTFDEEKVKYMVRTLSNKLLV